MAHVELSVTGQMDPTLEVLPYERPSSMDRWTEAVRDATEPCLVLSELQTIVAASASACALLGLANPQVAKDVSLFAGVIRFVDFTKPAGDLAEGDLEKIPLVLAYTSGRLARGLLRIHAGDDEPPRTLDAIATPVMEGEKVVGSLTFLSLI